MHHRASHISDDVTHQEGEGAQNNVPIVGVLVVGATVGKATGAGTVGTGSGTEPGGAVPHPQVADTAERRMLHAKGL